MFRLSCVPGTAIENIDPEKIAIFLVATNVPTPKKKAGGGMAISQSCALEHLVYFFILIGNNNPN